MRLISHTIEYTSRSDVFRIVPLSDIHLGNKACDEKLFKRVVDDIAHDDKCYTILLGDMCEFINRKDRRFDPEDLPNWLWGKGDLAKAQRAHLIEILKPIGPKILASVEGNHERAIYDHWERDVYSSIIENLCDKGEPKLVGPSGFLRLTFKRLGNSAFVLTFFLTHGWWGGRLMGAGALNLERILGWVEADIVLAGHDHRKRVIGMSKLYCTRYGVRTKNCYAASCGSFLDQPAYAERAGMRPLPVGPIEILIEPDKKQVKFIQ